MTYDEWKAEYVELLTKFLNLRAKNNTPTVSTDGKLLDSVLDPEQRELAEKLGKMVDEYPEYDERFDEETFGDC